MKNIILLLTLLAIVIVANGQDPATSFTLNQSVSGTKTYTARDFIKLEPGFSYKPTTTATFNAKIDGTITYPVTYQDAFTSVAQEPSTGLDLGSIPGSFNVTPSGGSSYTVPIDLPIGLDGLQPSISIAYNSQVGNGLAGWGCNIAGISAITRVPQDYYYNDYFKGITLTATDRFALDGNRLMTIGTYGASGTTYNTLMRNFAIITSREIVGTDSPNFFEVEPKDGKKLEYGSTTGKLSVNNTDGTTAYVVSWYLDYMEDVNGNYMSYEYEQDGLTTYLKKISYGLNKNNSDGILCEVVFTYEKRLDEIPIVIGMQTGKMDRILARISTYINSELQNSYDLAYSKDMYSRLKSITKKNSAGNELNPTIFCYGVFKAGSDLDFDSQNIVVPAIAGKPFETQIWYSGDRDGVGKDELISTYPYTNNNWSYTNVNIRAATPDESGSLTYKQQSVELFQDNLTQAGGPFNSYWKNIGRNVMASSDFNGDGNCDFMNPKLTTLDLKLSCFQVLDGMALNQVDITHNFNKKPIDLGNLSQIPLFLNSDFNNDGNSDLLVLEKLSDDQFRNSSITFLSQNDFDNPSESRNRIEYKFQTPGVPEEIFPFDYNNDGLKDLLIITGNAYYIYKNNGGTSSSSFETIASVNNSNTLKGRMISIRPGDFNGDGLMDFVYNPLLNPSSWYFALNKGDGKFGIISLNQCTTTDCGSLDDDKDNCIVMDWNNDGMDDFITFDALYDTDSKFINFIVSWYQSTGTNVIPKEQITTGDVNYSFKNLFVQGDFDGDNRKDFMNYGFDCWNGTTTTAWRIYSNYNAGQNQGLLTGVADGLGNRSEITYTNTILNENYTASTPISGLIPLPAALTIVDTVKTIGGTNSNFAYTYEGATAHPLLGFLGFAKTAVTNTNSTNKVESVYSFKESASEYFMPYLKSTSKSIIDRVSKVTNSLSITYKGNNNIFPDGSCFIYPHERTAIDYISSKKETQTVSYDDQGNLESSTTEIAETGGTVIATSTKSYSGYSDFPSLDNNHTNNAPTSISETYTLNSATEGAALTHTSTLVYNTNGTVKSLQDSRGITTTNTYFSYSQRLKDVSLTADGSTRKTSYTYDPTSRFVNQVTNPLLHVTKYTSDNRGNVLTMTDPNNKTTTNKYNSWDLLTESVTPDGTYTTTTDWDLNGADKITGALYYTETLRKDLFSSAEYFNCQGKSLRKVSVGFNGARLYTDTEYNELGQVKSVSDPYSGTKDKTTSYTYDTEGRIKTQIYDGITTTFTYENQGSYHDVKSSSVKGTFTKKYNAAGLITEATDPGGTISYAYFKNGKLKSTTSGGTSVGIRYDALGRQEYLDDPDAGTIQYGYNAWNELTLQKQLTNTTVMTYDKLGRMKTSTLNGTATTYNYDPANGIGMLESVIKGTSGMYYKYDGLLNMIEEKCKEGTDELKYTYEYDAAKNRLNKMTYPGGFAIQYGYTQYDDIIQISNASNSSLIWRLDDVTPKGQIWKATYGNNKQTIFEYDNDKITRINTPTVIDFNYTFNELDQISGREEKYYANGQPSSFIESFNYDAVNRLTIVQHQTSASAPKVTKLQMTYNPTSKDRIDKKSDAGTFVYDNPANHKVNHLNAIASYLPTKQTYTFTPTGKVGYISDDAIRTSLTFTYNVLDQRFKQVISNIGLNLTSYYFNNYEKEITNGTTTRHLNYVYAGGRLVAIFTQTGTTTTPYYIYTDYLGSLRSITNGSGAVVQTLSFDAWGNRRNPLTGVNYTTTPTGLLFARGFTGHEHVDMLGLINMNGRFYDPALGLFTSPDNYIQAPDFTQNFNRYTYCLNNPLMYTDPDGELFWLIPVAIGLFAGGYIGGAVAAGDGGFSHADWNAFDGSWKGTDWWKGAIVGGIVGAGAGAALAAAVGASGTGLATGAGLKAMETSLAWEMTANGLITANVNMLSAGIRTDWNLDVMYKEGLIGLAAGAGATALASGYFSHGQNGFGYWQSKGLSIRNQFTAVSNGFGTRMVEGYANGLRGKDLWLEGGLGALEGYVLTMGEIPANRKILRENLGLKTDFPGRFSPFRFDRGSSYLSMFATSVQSSMPGNGFGPFQNLVDKLNLSPNSLYSQDKSDLYTKSGYLLTGLRKLGWLYY
ncbi:MAG: RHS repeat-associated core domain-containing protein [Salinivirgaceae bacterium]